MEQTVWRRAGAHWPFLFTAAVVGWFVINGLGLTHLSLPHLSTHSTKTIEANKPATINAPVSGHVDIQVESFRLQPSTKPPGSLRANVTLQLKNTGTANANFRPRQLTLRRVGGPSATGDLGSQTITVSRNVPVIVPMTFTIAPARDATYELTYGNQVVYSGKPT